MDVTLAKKQSRFDREGQGKQRHIEQVIDPQVNDLDVSGQTAGRSLVLIQKHDLPDVDNVLPVRICMTQRSCARTWLVLSLIHI